jgi:hypothetical protein
MQGTTITCTAYLTAPSPAQTSAERPVLQSHPKEAPESGRFTPSDYCGVDTSSPNCPIYEKHQLGQQSRRWCDENSRLGRGRRLILRNRYALQNSQGIVQNDDEVLIVLSMAAACEVRLAMGRSVYEALDIVGLGC